MIQKTAESPVPGLDPVASARWLRLRRESSPWLHEEVARRMIERLQWFRDPPASWLHWEPLIGGMDAHRLLLERLPQARTHVWPGDSTLLERLNPRSGMKKWVRLPWLNSATAASAAQPDTQVDMLWSNMALHQLAYPQTLLQQWHQQIAEGGFLMFSCLGPDSLAELRTMYAEKGWPPPMHSLTDMHDWGDMLVHGGFAEPVMDMERITLTYSHADALLDELRQLGRNLCNDRPAGLRGRSWRDQLASAVEEQGARTPDGRLKLTFEVIYGHAFKAAPRPPKGDSQTVSVDAMRSMLRSRKS